MWPFKKKAEAEATACSGILTCDGKSHTWTTWEDIQQGQVIFDKGMIPTNIVVDAQERTCILCHYKDRRIIGED